MSVDVGHEAPDFELQNQFGTPVRLSQYRGEKNVMIVFFPKAFTATCTGELCALRDERLLFEDDETVLLGISCDTTASLKVFAEQESYTFDLLSDFWPHGEVTRTYGVLFEPGGFPMRATFIVDKAGIVRWSIVNGPGDARPLADYHDALAAL